MKRTSQQRGHLRSCGVSLRGAISVVLQNHYFSAHRKASTASAHSVECLYFWRKSGPASSNMVSPPWGGLRHPKGEHGLSHLPH